MIAFFAHALFVLAAWTIAIKYAFPVGYAAWEGVALTRYVMVDFWWVVHIWLGVVLLRWRSYTYALAVVTSVVEIAIVATKFVLFLSAPVWTVWTASWFVNKCFVLAVFALLLGCSISRAGPLRSRTAGGGAPGSGARGGGGVMPLQRTGWSSSTPTVRFRPLRLAR